ncbi:MAG: hypothetical protein J6K31_15020, partial [Parabacteroides sp.]|nr:hypothetical protein [Parabacteroides sp.]
SACLLGHSRSNASAKVHAPDGLNKFFREFFWIFSGGERDFIGYARESQPFPVINTEEQPDSFSPPYHGIRIQKHFKQSKDGACSPKQGKPPALTGKRLLILFNLLP